MNIKFVISHLPDDSEETLYYGTFFNGLGVSEKNIFGKSVIYAYRYTEEEATEKVSELKNIGWDCQTIGIFTITGRSLDDDGHRWTIECPKCLEEQEFKGFFDPSEVDTCKCGVLLHTEAIFFEDESYIQ